jgi:hypothetical protein
MADSELVSLTEGLGAVLGSGLGVRSRWALRTAIDAARSDGISGVLVVKIPAKGAEFCDVNFTVGSVELVERWGS